MKQAVRDVTAEQQYRAHELDRVKAAIARFQVPVADRVMLDLGCNDGALTAGYLQLAPRELIGVDVDEAAIARASSRHLPIRFLVSGVNGIPLPDASVDTVVSYDVFEHVENPASVASELARIVRADGTVLIGTWSWCHPFAPHLWSVMPVPWAHLMVSEKTLLAACRRVYHSPWYVPDRHDFNAAGERKRDKYTQDFIPRSYLNQYRIEDFERAFQSAGWTVDTYPQPFGSLKFSATLLRLRGMRDWLSGYVWFVLRRHT